MEGCEDSDSEGAADNAIDAKPLVGEFTLNKQITHTYEQTDKDRPTDRQTHRKATEYRKCRWPKAPASQRKTDRKKETGTGMAHN